MLRLINAALALLLGLIVFRSLRTGEIGVGLGYSVTREERPINYWMHVAFCACMAVTEIHFALTTK